MENGMTLEVSVKDSMSARLKAMTRTLSGVRELVETLRADFSTLGDTARSSLQLDGAAGTQLEALSSGALRELDAAFQDSGKTVAAYYAERRRQGGETAASEQEQTEAQAARLTEALEIQREARRLDLESLREHGKQRVEATQAQADQESAVKVAQAERERAIDTERLEQTRSLAGGMADAMKQVYESGLIQSKAVYRMYQALAIAETTISTYKAAQEAYAQGVGWGGPVAGAIMAATAIAAGMARVAAIKTAQPKGFAFGGLIGGADRGERADNVLIRATPGEYMLDRPTVRHYGLSALEALRSRSVPREMLKPFASPRLPASRSRAAYAYGGEIGTASLAAGGGRDTAGEGLTVINVMDFQREFDRALASARGRRVLVNILGEEGIAS